MSESKGVKELAKNVDNPDDAAELIKETEKILKNKKNNFLMLAYQQGEIFRRFKTNNNLQAQLVNSKLERQR